jgi:hypothetical protein
MQSNRVIRTLKQRNKSPDVILEFTPNPTFKEEFLQFVEEILSWERKEKKNSFYEKSNNNFNNKNLYDKSKM